MHQSARPSIIGRMRLRPTAGIHVTLSTAATACVRMDQWSGGSENTSADEGLDPEGEMVQEPHMLPVRKIECRSRVTKRARARVVNVMKAVSSPL